MHEVVMSIKELLELHPIFIGDNINTNSFGKFDEYISMNDLFLIKYGAERYIVSPNKRYLSYLLYISKNYHKISHRILNSSCRCYIIDYDIFWNFISFSELCQRYSTREELSMESSLKLASIKDEEENYSDNDLYDITSWGADLSFRELLTMYNDGDLLKPELQRKYVWTKKEASRFIDSVLLGLPVPSIFLAKEKNETLLIVDGFQRIMTVNDFINGIFGGDNKSFKLLNSESINEKWRNKTFAELTPEEQRKIRNTTIHAIIFEQKRPKNNTGMYQVFERINTTGKILKPQEIRNCVYQGRFNDLLFDVNKNRYWRLLLKLQDEDSRMADLELILRFFAMCDLHNRKEGKQAQINLTKYLNIYMGDHRNMSDEEYEGKKQLFVDVVKVIYSTLENYAFRNAKVTSYDTTSNKDGSRAEVIFTKKY